MHRKSLLLVLVFSLVLLLGACAQQPESPPLLGNSLHSSNIPAKQQSTPATPVNIQAHVSTPAPSATPNSGAQATPAAPVPTTAPPTGIPATGTGSAPYGPPAALTAEEVQLTQKLFALINSDRAAQGLYPFTWNATLSGGARLHSWNMYHCGFSHTCPDGLQQCQRIANEGFAGYSDCGENIGYAGPYPTPWDGVHNIQESMANEPPTGWHHIHLFSTTLHRVGVGIYVDPGGYIWFTEDMVS